MEPIEINSTKVIDICTDYKYQMGFSNDIVRMVDWNGRIDNTYGSNRVWSAKLIISKLLRVI